MLLASALLLMGVDHAALKLRQSHLVAMEGQRLCQQAIVENPKFPRRGMLRQPALWLVSLKPPCLVLYLSWIIARCLEGHDSRACVVITLEAESVLRRRCIMRRKEVYLYFFTFFYNQSRGDISRLFRGDLPWAGLCRPGAIPTLT